MATTEAVTRLAYIPDTRVLMCFDGRRWREELFTERHPVWGMMAAFESAPAEDGSLSWA